MSNRMLSRFVLVDDDTDQPIAGYETLKEAKQEAREMDNPAIFIRDVVSGENFKPDDEGRFTKLMRGKI